MWRAWKANRKRCQGIGAGPEASAQGAWQGTRGKVESPSEYSGTGTEISGFPYSPPGVPKSPLPLRNPLHSPPAQVHVPCSILASLVSQPLFIRVLPRSALHCARASPLAEFVFPRPCPSRLHILCGLQPSPPR